MPLVPLVAQFRSIVEWWVRGPTELGLQGQLGNELAQSDVTPSEQVLKLRMDYLNVRDDLRPKGRVAWVTSATTASADHEYRIYEIIDSEGTSYLQIKVVR